MIKDIRIDDRLIHGQVCGYWVPQNSIEQIVVVDDEIVKDATRKRALAFGCPEKVKLSFHSAAKTAQILMRGEPATNVMLLARSPKAYRTMAEAGYAIDKISVGNISPRGAGDDIHVKGTTYITPADAEDFKALIARGTQVILQTIPRDAPDDLAGFFARL